MDSPDITSLIPIIITLAISLYTKNVVLGLFLGVFSGVFMLNNFQPIDTFTSLMKGHLVPQLTDSYNAGVLVLLIFIGGFVALMEKSGGASAFANKITNWISNRYRAQVSGWLGGIMVFFSDLGTPLIIGPVFRPLFDKLKVSREKLAFVIDSTSSPVAILIPFIGWGVYIMSLIQKEFTALNVAESDWSAFISAIPYQFYAFLAIAIVPLLAFSKLDFGPMADAETRAKQGLKPIPPVGVSADTPTLFTHKNATPALVWLPLLVMATVLFGMLGPLGFPFQKVAGSTFRAALSTAYLLAATTLIGLMAYQKVRSLADSFQIYLQGMGGMMQVAIILILAWTLSGVGKELGTSQYIAELAQNGFPVWLIPAMAFLLSAIISFATGSSWGTFAIMMPLVIPTAILVDAPLYACIGAVLSGGLFGDHSSPISETTILSSTGAGCNQFEHFRTQLPYALMNGSVAFICFIIAGITASPMTLFIAFALQVVVLYGCYRHFNRQKQLQQATQ
ncbi:sodium:proton exchanger [Vibrio sp. SS-MA-C1-2]|nr:Na+/H+ antiporter NhaC family protein [Vibrio sp. SS-MA-C1-2]UJF17765.1 sodium:proton exchanger [Vibrio sp. SS-MA-C1-2]